MRFEAPAYERRPDPAAALARTRLGIRKLFNVPFDSGRTPGALKAPLGVLLADDGRAVAWFGACEPFVVHPSLAELCAMHGVEARSGR